MSETLVVRCEGCGTYQSRAVSQNDRKETVCTCSGCGGELRCDPGVKRFVLDGPPGSGKSTVLFGMSDGETGDAFARTMSTLGHHCLHESVAQAHELLSGRGVDFTKDKELWLQTIVEIDRDKYFAAASGINFYDRCFHHWRLLSEVAGIRLPDWYDTFNGMLRYASPVFLCAPIKSMDLTAPEIMASRRFTWAQRCDLYARTRSLYRELGYEVVEVPVFYEGDVERNNRARIEHILAHAGLMP